MRDENAAAALARELLQDESLEVVRALALAAARLEDDEARQAALQALAGLADQPGRDQVWAAWDATRHPGLEALLVENRWTAARPERLRVLSLLKTGLDGALAASGPEGVEALLAAAADLDPQIAAAARRTLRSLQDPAARDELCRWVIEHDLSQARSAALEAGYTPRDPQRRALFFLLTEQWERYAGLDFDASLVRAVFETGSDRLRGKIAELARAAGWAGYVEAAAGSRSRRRLGELSAVEWEVILALLGREGQWGAVWDLAQAAPPLWSARLLRALQEAGWTPAGSEAGAAFTGLAAAAAAALEAGPPTEKRLRFEGILSGHTRLVTALAFRPDGRLLASASADKTVRLWGLGGEAARIALEGHAGYVYTLKLSPDGAFLASGGADRTVRLWRLPDGPLSAASPLAWEPAHILGGHAGEVSALAFSPDGSLLASGDSRGVRLWRTADGRLLHLLTGHKGIVTALAFSGMAADGMDAEPDGGLLVSGGEDKSVLLWRVKSGELAAALQDNTLGWAVSPDGQLLGSGSTYGRMRLWSLPGGNLLATLPGRSDGRIVAFSPAGGWIAGTDGATARLWALPGAAGETEPAALEGHSKAISTLVFSGTQAGPDGSLLATGSDDRTVRLWALTPAGQVGPPRAQTARLQAVLADFNAPVKLLAFSPAGDRLAAGDGERLRLWALDDLGGLFRAPVAAIRPEALAAAEEAAREASLAAASASRGPAGPTPAGEGALAGRRWLDFTRRLVDWSRRHDIQLEEAPQRIAIGEFDIEIE